MFLTKTYAIEDCTYWNATGCTFTSNSTTDRVEPTGLEAFEYTPPSHWQLSFDLYDDSNSKRFYLVSKPQSSSSSNKYGVGADTNSSTHNVAMVLRTTTSASQQGNSSDYPAHIRWEIDNGTTKGYVGNTLVRTDSVNWWGSYAPYIFKWGIWAKGTVTVTNIKIKPL